MIEKKTLWAVSTDLELKPKTVITDDGKVVACKNEDDKWYDGTMWKIRKFFDTEDEAREYIAKEEAFIRDMVPTVRKFIDRMEMRYDLRQRLGIEKKDYLGDYANRPTDNYRSEYLSDHQYAKKLEAFVRSRTLNIGGWSLPVDSVKRVQWFFHDEEGDEYEDCDWLAELTMTDGETVRTTSVEEVRLIKAVFGENSGTYFVDNDFDYSNDNEDEEG